MIWPYHLNCCSSISCNTFFFISIFLIISFLILSIHDILAECLDNPFLQLIIYVCISILLTMFQLPMLIYFLLLICILITLLSVKYFCSIKLNLSC
jgi:hypothetical protein